MEFVGGPFLLLLVVGVVVVGLAASHAGRRSSRRHRSDDRITLGTFHDRHEGRLLASLPSEDHIDEPSVELVAHARSNASDAAVDEHVALTGIESVEHAVERPPAVGLEITEPADTDSIEQLVAHHLVEAHREQHTSTLETNPVLVELLLAEARDLIVDLNHEFGWAPGEPSIADRLFNTNVAAVLGAAKSRGVIDFRTRRMIAVLRSFARAANGGRNELAKVMATRVLLGTARLTEEELQKLTLARQLFGDDFAEAAGYVDHLDRAQELSLAKRLGRSPSPVTDRDRPARRERSTTAQTATSAPVDKLMAKAPVELDLTQPLPNHHRQD